MFRNVMNTFLLSFCLVPLLIYLSYWLILLRICVILKALANHFASFWTLTCKEYGETRQYARVLIQSGCQDLSKSRVAHSQEYWISSNRSRCLCIQGADGTADDVTRATFRRGSHGETLLRRHVAALQLQLRSRGSADHSQVNVAT